MNRIDRLFAILLLLQRKRRMRAADLARSLEVSERTIYRDMSALAESGVPVVGTPGRGVAATSALPWSGARAGMDFAGTGVATILLGLVNLLTIRAAAAGQPTWLPVHGVNTVMAAFLTVFVIVAFEPPVGVAWR